MSSESATYWPSQKSHRGIPCRTTFSPVFIHWGIPTHFLGINQNPLVSPIQSIPNLWGKNIFVPICSPAISRTAVLKRDLSAILLGGIHQLGYRDHMVLTENSFFHKKTPKYSLKSQTKHKLLNFKSVYAKKFSIFCQIGQIWPYVDHAEADNRPKPSNIDWYT